MAFLIDERKGCFNGFEQGHHAMKTPSHHPSQKPSTFPPFRGVRGALPFAFFFGPVGYASVCSVRCPLLYSRF